MIRFSIFLPLRNGMPYVRDCVESILNQSYPHFDLVILDNASTDGSADWVAGLDDSRIRYVKSDKSLSIQESWARIKQEPKQEFMTMIGHDDILDRDFLEIIVGLIQKDPGASLFQTGSRLINAKGEVIRACVPVPEKEVAAEYLRARFSFKRDVFGTGYVMKSMDYDEIGGIYDFEKLFFADDALWLSLSKKSWKISDSREAFSVRIHPKSESASLPSVWQSMLLGINQFIGFLQEFIEDDEGARIVYQELAQSFLLAYHRNIYIFALIDACQKNQKISQESVERIKASLANIDPGLAGQLSRSLKVQIIEMLNASVFRGSVVYLWRIYGYLKSKTY